MTLSNPVTTSSAPQGGSGRPTAPIEMLSRFVHDLHFGDLPVAVQKHAAEIVLDMFGVIIWGSQDSFLRRFRERLLPPEFRGRATVLGTSFRVDPGYAALFNAAATTVTQIDEGHRRALGHPGIHIIPAVLAIAEQEGLGGRDLIAAIVAGYEVGVRIGQSMRPLRPGIHAHGHWPVIAAAVAGAKLLGADVQSLGAAIESAATLTLQPATRTVTDGVTAHHLFAGLGAQTAVTVAYGVRAGMTGSPGTLLEYLGPRSAVDFRPELLTEGLEPDHIRYEILNSYFKFQPVCAHAITTIEAVDALRPQLASANHVRSVTVRTYGFAAELFNPDPQTTLAAKFSIPFVVAARLLYPNPHLTALHDQDLHDPQLHELMHRIQVIKDPVLDAEYPGTRPSIVELELTDGTHLCERRDMPKGDADNPATLDDLVRKFIELVTPILGRVRAEELVQCLTHIAEIENLSEVTRKTLTGEARPNTIEEGI